MKAATVVKMDWKEIKEAIKEYLENKKVVCEGSELFELDFLFKDDGGSEVEIDELTVTLAKDE